MGQHTLKNKIKNFFPCVGIQCCLKMSDMPSYFSVNVISGSVFSFLSSPYLPVPCFRMRKNLPQTVLIGWPADRGHTMPRPKHRYPTASSLVSIVNTGGISTILLCMGKMGRQVDRGMKTTKLCMYELLVQSLHIRRFIIFSHPPCILQKNTASQPFRQLHSDCREH